MKSLTQIDPLIWFFFIGGMLFFFVALKESNSPSPESMQNKSLLSMPGALESQYVDKYTQLNGYAPSSATIQAFRESWVQEELLFREGLALGLVENDPVIRRRIVEKVQLLFSDTGASEVVERQELIDFYHQYSHRYIRPETFSFTLYSIHPTQIPPDFSRQQYLPVILAALKNGANPENIGLETSRYDSLTEEAVSVQLDDSVMRVLRQLSAENVWQMVYGDDTYGLIHLDHYQPEQQAKFEEVEQRVVVDFKNAQRKLAIETKIEHLEKKYSVLWQEGSQ